MSYNYKKAYVPAKGYTPICKIGECSLKKLEFGIIELSKGERLSFDTKDKETAFIMLQGHCDVKADDLTWENVGNRQSVFENRKAESFYMPIETICEITAIDDIKIAVCATPVKEKTEPQVLREDHVVLKLLGEVPFQRETSFIIDGNSNAKFSPLVNAIAPKVTGQASRLISTMRTICLSNVLLKKFITSFSTPNKALLFSAFIPLTVKLMKHTVLRTMNWLNSLTVITLLYLHPAIRPISCGLWQAIIRALTAVTIPNTTGQHTDKMYANRDMPLGYISIVLIELMF